MLFSLNLCKEYLNVATCKTPVFLFLNGFIYTVSHKNAPPCDQFYNFCIISIMNCLHATIAKLPFFNLNVCTNHSVEIEKAVVYE